MIDYAASGFRERRDGEEDEEDEQREDGADGLGGGEMDGNTVSAMGGFSVLREGA